MSDYYALKSLKARHFIIATEPRIATESLGACLVFIS